MRELIAQHALIAIFVAAIFEGDVTLILAGVAAHLGVISFPFAVVAGAAGGVVADFVCYELGRRRAQAIRQTRLYARVGAIVERLADRVGPVEIVFARFVYGARVASMLLWGIRGLPASRFVMLDIVGCLLWAGALASGGFIASGSAVVLIGRVKHIERWLFVALLASALVMVLVHGLLRRRRERSAPVAILPE